MGGGPLALRGFVTKVGAMNKTATVTVWRWVVHKRTGKRMHLSKKYLTHDEQNILKLEDEVDIINCPPVSARKRFTLKDIVHSPELKKEIIRESTAREAEAASLEASASPPPPLSHPSRASYDKALAYLNERRKGAETLLRNAQEAAKAVQAEKERQEMIEAERKRGEEKKRLREAREWRARMIVEKARLVGMKTPQAGRVQVHA